jgi:hypothetical protein
MGKTEDFEYSLQVLRGFQADITAEANEIKVLDNTDFNFVDSRYTSVQLFVLSFLSHQSSCQWIDFNFQLVWGSGIPLILKHSVAIGDMNCIIVQPVYTEISSIIKEDDNNQVRRYQA